MAKTQKTKKRTQKHEMIDEKTMDLISSPMPSTYTDTGRFSRWLLIGALVVILLIAFLGSRGYIVAAMVNGRPIFRWDLNNTLMSRFGQQTLESMISERLLSDEAQKKDVHITNEEVNAKMNDLVKSLGPNVKLEDVLQYQGMTKQDFANQIRLQLTVEKILGKDVSITDKEVDDYLQKNKQTLTATDEAGMRVEAKDALLSQKINDKIQPWFADLKQKANIIRLAK